MLKLYPAQKTGYPPQEHGQVLEINPHCMKVNFGFRFIRGIFTGMIVMIIVLFLLIDLAFGGNFDPTIRFISDFRDYYPHIGIIVFLELYLWPSAPPMVFDRVNRRVIFQVLFRTKIIAWDSCVASIQYVAQASESGATQAYYLRIEGEVINRKPSRKTQRAAALIHQSGISDDLLNYWEYVRQYMESGPTAVPEPHYLYERNPFSAAWYTFNNNYPGLAFSKLFWAKLHEPEHGLIKRFFFLISIPLAPVVTLLSLPLVVPLFTVAFIAAKTGRVRRYPKEIRQLCKKGRELAIVQPTQLDPNKLVIRIDGKPIEVDWPADAWKQSPSTKPPPQ